MFYQEVEKAEPSHYPEGHRPRNRVPSNASQHLTSESNSGSLNIRSLGVPPYAGSRASYSNLQANARHLGESFTFVVGNARARHIGAAHSEATQ